LTLFKNKDVVHLIITNKGEKMVDYGVYMVMKPMSFKEKRHLIKKIWFFRRFFK